MYRIISTCKGGGYEYCRTTPEHPKRNSKGLYPLHRVIAENKLGRSLRDDEDVHHINGDKFDNSPYNLHVCSKSEHSKIHGADRIVERVQYECPVCQGHFSLKPSRAEIRRKASRFGLIFCSRSCGAKHQNSVRQPAFA